MDALVQDHLNLIEQMPNHPKDRHVTACAVAGKAKLIVTSNIKDFSRLPWGIKAITPDDFLPLLLTKMPQPLYRALHAQSERLTRSPMTVSAIVERLGKVAPRFAETWKLMPP